MGFQRWQPGFGKGEVGVGVKKGSMLGVKMALGLAKERSKVGRVGQKGVVRPEKWINDGRVNSKGTFPRTMRCSRRPDLKKSGGVLVEEIA